MFSLLLYLDPVLSFHLIEKASLWVRDWFGKFYLWLGLGCVLLMLLVAILPIGRMRLGQPGEKPVFSRMAWVSMLYSAGMGAGILLRAVQEPVFMQQHPPLSTGSSPETIALEYTFYQWGFTAWAFYGIFAILMGLAIFRYHRPIALISIFQVRKSAVKDLSTTALRTVDILIILTTVCGLVAAVGLGASQIKGGVDHLNQAKLSHWVIVGLTVAIGVLALVSALSGVERGIKRLSTWNIYLTLGLLTFVLVQSDLVEVGIAFAKAGYHYLIDFIPMSLALGGHDPGEAFLTDWTYYYWAFWLAWAPFTGMFIARISRGRSLREIVFFVLLVPSLGTFFWFTVFGQSAFEMIQSWGDYSGQFDNVFTSLFRFLEEYPLSGIVNGVVVLLLVSFLVTSVDSAIYVLSMFTDNGRQNPSRFHRTLWGILLTLFSVGIVLLGHARPDTDVLTAVQKLLIITSLPLAFILIAAIAITIYQKFPRLKHNQFARK